MAKDIITSIADVLGKGVEGAKKLKREKLPDKELDKYREELKGLRKNVGKMPLNDVTRKLRDAFMVDMDELKITDPLIRGEYWDQAFREAYIEIQALKNNRIETAKRTLDQIVKESTHASLESIIRTGDPEAEGTQIFTEILNKFPGGKKGMAASFSLLSILGIKKDSTMGKFIEFIKENLGFGDEKKKDPETTVAQTEAEKKEPKLNIEAIKTKFTKAEIELDQGNMKSDIAYLKKNPGKDKLSVDKRIKKGLTAGSNFMKIAEEIKKGLKDQPFKFRLQDLRLDQLSETQAKELQAAIKKKKDLKPEAARTLLNYLSEPAKLAKAISIIEKVT